MEVNPEMNIEFLVSNQDKFIKQYGEKQYFDILNTLIAAKKLKDNQVIKADTYLKLGGDI